MLNQYSPSCIAITKILMPPLRKKETALWSELLHLIVAITCKVFVSRNPPGRWVVSSTQIQRYNKNSNYKKYFHNFCKFLFRPLRKRLWSARGCSKIPNDHCPANPVIFSEFSFYGPFGRRMVRWSTFAGKPAKSPEIGQIGHKGTTAAFHNATVGFLFLYEQNQIRNKDTKNPG